MAMRGPGGGRARAGRGPGGGADGGRGVRGEGDQIETEGFASSSAVRARL